MEDRDQTEIAYTIADRLLAQKTQDAVEDIKSDIKEMSTLLTEYIKANDDKVDAVCTDHKVFKRVIKIGVSIIGGLIGLAAAVKAYF